MKKQGNTLFHLQLKADQKDYYFGSIAAIYDLFTPKVLGVTQNRLYCFNIEEDKPYKNKICIIKKTSFYRKPKSKNKINKITKQLVFSTRYIK